MDSDFDIDENDEPVSDTEVEEKAARQVGTKAYKVRAIPEGTVNLHCKLTGES